MDKTWTKMEQDTEINQNFCSFIGDQKIQFDNCFNYLTVWLFTFPQRGFIHFGLVFCRSIYIRLASGLVKDGIKLLHGLTIIFITVFSLQIQLMWPVRHVLSGNSYQDTLKGKFCTKTNIAGITVI